MISSSKQAMRIGLACCLLPAWVSAWCSGAQHPWDLYAVVALSQAYFQFRKSLPGLISSTLYPLIGERGIRGPIGKFIDAIAVIVTLFGVATFLGLGAQQLTTGMNFQFGISNTTTVAVLLIAIINLCEEPCQTVCPRREMDGAISTSNASAREWHSGKVRWAICFCATFFVDDGTKT
ncbi:BCCT family transporter [Desulfosporosinus shakirovi]